MPQVAVIIPVYNPDPSYLRAALASLASQTFPDWECVVVDDGSPDPGDLSWISHRVIRQANSGAGIARNRGIRETSAPLLAFLDQDDLWAPTYLERQVEQFRDPAVVMSSTGFDIIDDHGARIGGGYVGHNASYEDLLEGCGVQLSAVMARRDAVEHAGGFRPYPFAQDWDLWLRITRDGGRLGRVEEELVSWRQHGANASRQYRQLLIDSRAILAGHDHPAAKRGLRRMRELSGIQAFDRARESRDVRALAWALWHAPRPVTAQLARKVASRVTPAG